MHWCGHGACAACCMPRPCHHASHLPLLRACLLPAAHRYCRETCGLCRLPAGRPQRPFRWDGSVPGSEEESSSGAGAGGNRGDHGSNRHQRWHAGISAGGQPAFARIQWHALHASFADADDALSAAGAGAASHAILYGGLAGWALLLAAVLGMAAHSLWGRRQARLRGAGGSRGHRGGGGGSALGFMAV